MSNYRIDPVTGEVVKLTEQEKQEILKKKVAEEEQAKKFGTRFVRTVAGAGTDLVNSMIDLGRTLHTFEGLPSPTQDPEEFRKKK